MPKVNKDSDWRKERIQSYQLDFLEELPKHVVPKQQFLVKDVWHKMACLKHLSDSYAYDVAVAICTQAVIDGLLKRTGRFFSIKESYVKKDVA